MNEILEGIKKKAEKIADLYLSKNQRPVSYAVNIDDEDGNDYVVYRRLTEDDIDIIRKCSEIAAEESCSLGEVLDKEGHEDLVSELLETSGPYNMVWLDSVDLNDTLTFTKFSCKEINE
ncbi:MAG: hypothetical protein HUJ93_07285, partial [Bacteroidales bacterium]|nr:hypothetical protein [Bacteroidales bacterium]